jgi:hypothetical protein
MFDATGKDHGTDIAANLTLSGLHFNAPSQVKLVRGIRPKIDAATGTVVKVQIGAAMTPSSTPTWQTAVDFTVGTDIECHSFASGRFLALKLYTTSGLPWRIRSCELDIVTQGAY